LQHRYLFGLQIKQVVITRSVRSKRRIIANTRVLRMREIKGRLCLYTADLQTELRKQGFKITTFSLSAYLQGNIQNTEKLDLVLCQMEAVYKRLHATHGALIDPTMVQIFDSWCNQLDIIGAARARQLSQIVGHDPASLYRWYKHDRKPLPLALLIEMQERVNAKLRRRGKANSDS
jgi:hypothetical protein